MKTLINQILKGKIVLLFFIISSSLYFLMLFVTIPHLHKISEGIKILDMLPAGYDFEYVKKLMDALGEEGRHYYLFRQIPIDFIFPFFFAFSNWLITGWFLQKLGKLDTKWVYLTYLPILSGIFDYAENLGIVSILNSYPEISRNTVSMTNLFSVLKSAFTTVSLTIILLIIIVWVLKKLNKFS